MNAKTSAGWPVAAVQLMPSNPAHAIPGPCMSCGLETVTNVPEFLLCQSCVELGFTGPVEGSEVSHSVSQGSDSGAESLTSAPLQGSKRKATGVHTSPAPPRKRAVKPPKSYCPSCQATRLINRYEPSGKVYSITTTHQPACPALLARRETHHHD